MMEAFLNSIQMDQMIGILAPPGWGKTYKLLSSLKRVHRTVVFIFPLRALCDEVHLSAIKMGIRSINLRDHRDIKKIDQLKVKLVTCTPETVNECIHLKKAIFVLDEFHLFYYWGESFRQQMLEVFYEISAYSKPMVFLSATLSNELQEKVKNDLSLNYKETYLINIGNQKLKNYPKNIFVYLKSGRQRFLDVLTSSKKGEDTSLVFCKYRNQVKDLKQELESRGYSVITCIGGGGKEFILKLSEGKHSDYIVGTSVISHGVNLPSLKRVFFTEKVENLDFYLQMVGRGGRDGMCFELHTQNMNYFSKSQIVFGIIRGYLKIISIRAKKLIYSAYES